MAQNTPKNQEFSEDELFRFVVQQRLDDVIEIYQKHPQSHITKFTITEETALHIFISSYHSKLPYHSEQIKQMIDCLEKSDSLFEVLSMPNASGNTILHHAAGVGWVDICEYIASKHWNLISLRNALGETPLFAAALKDNLQAFLCLQQIYDQEGEADESLCRRKDGNTILHVAIAGEYFRFAYQIISYYPNLIHYVNVDGESPLHILARKPYVFKSRCQLGIFDSIIYSCLSVDKLKRKEYNSGATENRYSPCSEINLPENYRTCASIFFLFWTPIFKSITAVFGWRKRQNGGAIDEENQHHREKRTQDEESKDDDMFPPNYTSLFLSQFSKVILSVLGGGYFIRIKNIKEQHCHASQMMSEMIESESRYKYYKRQCPLFELELEERICIPEMPPGAYEYGEEYGEKRRIRIREMPPRAYEYGEKGEDHHKSEIVVSSLSEGKMKVQHRRAFQIMSKMVESASRYSYDEHDAVRTTDLLGIGQNEYSGFSFTGTPVILLAAKNGITEMVKKIIDAYPEAALDVDYYGKNVLLVAVENRQVSVFDLLLKKNLPEYMFYQVDDKGNSALHLAAMHGEDAPWLTSCVPLQLSWEIKWYQYVEEHMPPLVQYNNQGKSPGKIFTETHETLVKYGNEWLAKTFESCSVIAALIASVTFATIASVPGGLNDQTGHPILGNYMAFDVFSVASLFALCLSVTALIFFLAIITSPCKEGEFNRKVPRKLLIGLTSMSASIVAMLVAFYAGHTFILTERLGAAAVLIYVVASLPVMYFAIGQLPLYFHILCAACVRKPLLRYRVMHNQS